MPVIEYRTYVQYIQLSNKLTNDRSFDRVRSFVVVQLSRACFRVAAVQRKPPTNQPTLQPTTNHHQCQQSSLHVFYRFCAVYRCVCHSPLTESVVSVSYTHLTLPTIYSV